MIPWIQVYSNLPHHPKVSHLADVLGLSSAAVNPNAVAAGILICLWTWAVQNAPDGDLSNVSPRALADACLWKRSPQKLVEGLQTAGFLESDGRLHDWEEYALLYIDREARQREKTRERVRRYRERNAAGGVTVTPGNAPTVQDQYQDQDQEQNRSKDQYPAEQENCLLPAERKLKERSAFAAQFYAGCEGPLLRAKAVIAVMEARRAREHGDDREAAQWIGVAREGGLRVDAETLEYEG